MYILSYLETSKGIYNVEITEEKITIGTICNVGLIPEYEELINGKNVDDVLYDMIEKYIGFENLL